jgi:UDP-glucose 4-epimerase
MRVAFDDPRLSFFIGDVRDRRSVEQATRGAHLVFHAAALKQVPSCEFFPLQAVQTNIVGSANVIDSAVEAGVSSVVCLSTDKAVLPLNAMGMTKALMEKVCQAAARASDGATVVSTVRYGNVLCSRGSVIPLFIDQIFRGQALTVTDPEMTRFLMPLSQAVDLVEFAFSNAQPGDTFVRKAPAARIGDLAQAVNELFGEPTAIKEIGVRHGEKLYETLATIEELQRGEDLGDYWRIAMDSRDLNYSDYFEHGTPHDVTEDYHSHNTERLDVEGIKNLLMTLDEVREPLARWQAT